LNSIESSVGLGADDYTIKPFSRGNSWHASGGSAPPGKTEQRCDPREFLNEVWPVFGGLDLDRRAPAAPFQSRWGDSGGG